VIKLRRFGLAASLAVLTMFCMRGKGTAQSPVTVTVDQTSTGQTISSDFQGFSYETLLIFPDSSGNFLFSGTNTPLINMFKTLGIKSLRIGGNSADNASDNNGQLPADSTCEAADKCPILDNLYAFAQAAGIKIIFTLRLKVFDTSAAAGEAAYIMKHYASLTDCFEVGNEPNVYISSYSTYDSDFRAYQSAVLSAAPGAKFCSPATTNGGGQPWAESFANEFKGDGSILLICGHFYPGARTGNGTNADIDFLLDPSRLSTGSNNYALYYSQFPATAVSDSEIFRLEETNSLASQGEAGVSNVYASTLWALDYMHWWAMNNSQGLNFHTGATSVYDPIMPTTLSSSYTAEPVAYGIKAFGLGSSGENVSTVTGSNPSGVNITAYGVLDPVSGSLFVTIINKEHFTGARNATVTLQPGANYSGGLIWNLQQTNGDVTAAAGITLGGAAIGGDGSWNGKSSPIAPSASGSFTVSVPAASAVVVELTGKGAPPPPPQPASSLMATTISSSQINLSWTASSTSGVTYNIFRSTTSGFTPSPSNRITSGLTTTSFSDTGLAPSTSYFYLVEAVNAGGVSSAPTNQTGATTPAASPTTIQINAGGPAVSPFVADLDFSGGSTINHANTIDLSAVTNPAPMAVYQTARTGNFTYTIPGFNPGSSQTVRLHFAETFFSSAGSRTFNVSINGTQVLSNFDIFAAAGAQNKAIIEQFTETANSSGQYVIQFTSVINNSLVSGIEITSGATCTAPTAPSGLSATATSSSQINLSWTASISSCAVTYNLFRSTVSGFTPSASNQVASNVSGTSFSDTGLAASTTYFYLVEAVNSGGTSAASNQANATTQAGTTSAVQINCGGPAASPFVADVDFTGGGTIDHANTIDLSGVTNPAPMIVYQSGRVGNFTYTIPGLAPGSSHTVRLHFAETFFSSVGSRTFNVSINGTQVLTNFDIFAAAGVKNKAVIEQFGATANASGQVIIQFTSVVNQSLVSGIEVQ
jgi:chitodextrinase